MRPTFYRISPREIAILFVPVFVVIGLAWAFLSNHVQATPPSTLSISTGSESGAYFGFARQYQTVLQRSGVKLEIKTSAGSVENLKRLSDPNSGVDIAFMQGGITSSKTAPDLLSIGRVFYEPLWIFYRGEETIDRMAQLRGKRLAVGPEGSGTRALVMQLLNASGVSEVTATLQAISGGDAVKAVREGRSDAVFLVAAAEAPQVQALLRDPAFRVMSLIQAEAYTRLFPFLTRLVMPQGVVDLVQNIPPAEVVLVAPAAALLVRQDLHPAVASLLAQAAAEVHHQPALFARPGEFPKTVDPEFAISDSAQRFYKNGPPFLQRYLPFWLANLVERMVVLVVPLATIAIPLFKFLPWLYKWRVRQRMLKWYAALKKLEARLETQPTPAQVAQLSAEVEHIEDEVNDSPVPLGFSEQFYNLRAHIDLVRQRLGTRGRAVA